MIHVKFLRNSSKNGGKFENGLPLIGLFAKCMTALIDIDIMIVDQ
jgi:hypothetical protein